MNDKGHGSEVKVHMMLLFFQCVNNCWSRLFTLGYWLFYFTSVLTQMRKKNLHWKKYSLKWVCMFPFYPCHYWEQLKFQQLVLSLFWTHLLLDCLLWGTWSQYMFHLCQHITLIRDSLWPALVVHNHTSGCVSCLLGKICKIWCMCRWYYTYLSSRSQIYPGCWR